MKVGGTKTCQLNNAGLSTIVFFILYLLNTDNPLVLEMNLKSGRSVALTPTGYINFGVYTDGILTLGG